MGHAHRSRTAAGRLVAGLAALALALTLGACGDDDDDSASDTGSDTTAADDSGASSSELDVTELAFDDVTAPAGGTFDVVNSSGTAHTVTADDGEFDEELPDGDTVTIDVPAEPGEYGFHCEIHPSMTATLTAE